ncbi:MULTISPECIES: ferredoxin [unclassified Streptomyces]|uniref:ferredoxin n=1 Tax=unclassified Streptomyces TaxID=2593676 RepID=UPI0033B3EE8F
MVRIAVDLNRCQGYAQCAFLAPEVFAMHGEEALLYVPEADEAQREKLDRAAAACPVNAILVDAVDAEGAAPAVGDVPAEVVSHGR